MNFTEFSGWLHDMGLNDGDVAYLDRVAWDEAWCAHEGLHLDPHVLHEMGRQFIQDQVFNDTDMVFEYMYGRIEEDPTAIYRTDEFFYRVYWDV